MNTINREATQEDLSQFFLRDTDGDYLKEVFHPEEYPREPGIEGAQIFSEVEAMELINHNPDIELEMVTVSDVLDTNEYEIIEEHE